MVFNKKGTMVSLFFKNIIKECTYIIGEKNVFSISLDEECDIFTIYIFANGKVNTIVQKCNDYTIKDKQLDDFVIIKETKGRPSLLMSKYLVTQEEFEDVVGYNPSFFKGDPNLPVENVEYLMAVEYCINKSIADNLEPCYDIEEDSLQMFPFANGYRLPTGKEWYRAFPEYEEIDSDKTEMFDDIAWWKGNSDNKTHPVGLKKPNKLGLYDMLGNVDEWTNGHKKVCGNFKWQYGKRYNNDDIQPKNCGFRVVRKI